MTKRTQFDPWVEEARIRREHAEARAARLNDTLTRREMVDAIESVAHEYGRVGDHDSDLIANAFQKLAEALT